MCCMEHPVFKKRNIWIQLLLFFVTLGIYYVYWLYSTNKEIKVIDKSAPNPKTLVYIYTGFFLIFILPFLIGQVSPMAGMFSLFLYFLAIPLGIWSLVYLIRYLKSVFRNCTDVDVAPVILLLIFFSPGMIMYIQSRFNKYEFPDSPNVSEKEAYINQLRDYIKQVVEQGHSEDEVRLSLITQGYLREDVDKALKRL